MKKWFYDQDQSNATRTMIYFMNTFIGEIAIVALEHAMVIIVGRE